MKNYFLIVAGVICLLTALIHTFGGQIDLVNPMMDSNLKMQGKTEWLGVWHMATVILFVFAYVLLKNGFKFNEDQKYTVQLVGWVFILFGLVFVGASLFSMLLAPQFILCFPIGILALIGVRKSSVQ